MTRLSHILTDALILFLASTVLVVIANSGFERLKGKSGKEDPVVSAVVKGDLKELGKWIAPGESATRETDEHGRTALMRVAYSNLSNPDVAATTDGKRVEMIPLLIEKGAEVDARDNDGWTALMWASWSGMPKVTAELLKQGANPSVADTRGNTGLSIAAARAKVGIVRQLLETSAAEPAALKAAAAAAKENLASHPDQKSAYEEILRLLGAE